MKRLILFLLFSGSALAQTPGRQYTATSPIVVSGGNISLSGSNPPPTPTPITALTIQYANEGVTGTTLNKLVKIVNDPPVAKLLTTADTTSAFGVVSSGAGTTGSANVDVLGLSSCIFDGATTALNYVVSSVTVNGDCHDAGSGTTYPTGVVVLGRVLSTHGGGGTYTMNLFTPDTSVASAGPNGKGNTVQVNGSNAKTTINLNASTPAAPTGAINLTWQSSDSGNTTSASGYIGPQYAKFSCSPGLGDGLNAIAAGTYLQFNCVNLSGVTWTITGIKCWTDNAGTSTLNAANNAATALLTGAVTCNNTKSAGGAAGTQSATVTLANNDAISFTFVADGTSKQATWTVSLTQ